MKSKQLKPYIAVLVITLAISITYVCLYPLITDCSNGNRGGAVLAVVSIVVFVLWSMWRVVHDKKEDKQ